ncbi:MAG: hypothetical protein K9H26_14235 [Prolixibacteraceae bacterium]|nr:hypothetical protein [Prolixibacteraceae bacterium]
MELENDEIFENLKDMINNIPQNFKILEETIDLEVQKEYFESVKNIVANPEIDTPDNLILKLNDPAISTNERKTVLQKLANTDSVEAFRALENYKKAPHRGLHDWAILAHQQSKMLLHSSLLDEQQVFISTGLGGKNDKLRYFLIFPYNKPENNPGKLQKNSLKSELEFFTKNHQGVVEKIDFSEKFATAMVLLPLKAPIPDIIKDVISECNNYGSFLSEDVLITNMKKFSDREIIEIIEKQNEEHD